MIHDYNTLKLAVENYTLRTDQPFDTLLGIAENQIYRNLRVDLMLARECVKLKDDPELLIQQPPGFLEAKELTEDLTGTKVNFELIGSEIKLDKKRSKETLNLEFYKTPDSITAQNTTNDIIKKYPALYLYGVLSEHYQWVNDDINLAKYVKLFTDELSNANTADSKAWKLAQDLSVDLSKQP